MTLHATSTYRVEFTNCGAATVEAHNPDQARALAQHALLHGGCTSVQITEACLLPLSSISHINESHPR